MDVRKELQNLPDVPNIPDIQDLPNVPGIPDVQDLPETEVDKPHDKGYRKRLSNPNSCIFSGNT